MPFLNQYVRVHVYIYMEEVYICWNKVNINKQILMIKTYYKQNFTLVAI